MARPNKRQEIVAHEIRHKIQAKQLINRLHAHGMGEISLEQSQVSAIKILLDKSVPNLQAITIGNDPETGPIIVRWEQ